MSLVDEFIGDFLSHRIYDPVKAHEYYIRTRQLKGRHSRKTLRGKKKEGWLYVQDQVRGLKKEELHNLSEEHKVESKALHDNAKARRDEISDKIKLLMSGVSDNVKAQLAALPKGLSKEQRRQREADIRDRANLQKDQSKLERDNQRAKIAEDLKGSVETARENYKAAREQVKAKYEGILDSEYEAITRGA